MRAGGISWSAARDRWAAIDRATAWHDAARARARRLRPRHRQRPARCRRRAALVLSRCRDGCERRPLGGAGAGEPRHVRRRRILRRSAPPLARRCAALQAWPPTTLGRQLPGGATPIRWRASTAAPRCCAASARPLPPGPMSSRAPMHRAPGRPVRRSGRRIRWRTPAARLPSCELSCAISGRSGRRGSSWAACRSAIAGAIPRIDDRRCDDGARAAAQAVAVAGLLADRAAAGGRHRGDRHRWPDGPGRIPQWRAVRRHGRPAACATRRRPRSSTTSARPSLSSGARSPWRCSTGWRRWCAQRLGKDADLLARSPRSCKAEPGPPAARSRARAAPTARRRSGSSATARYSELEHREHAMEGVTVVDHPLVQHKLTLIRDKDRSTKSLPRAAQGDRHAAVLRGDARPAADDGRDRDAAGAHDARARSPARSWCSRRCCAPA